MASNSFGTLFRITTFGESHGLAIGVVIDGCPPGLPIDLSAVQHALNQRRPGQSPYVTPRNEPDRVELLSGVFEGKSTGAPLTLLIRNTDADPSNYEGIKDIYRPGHANFTYLKKYGLFDHRGGGRASARETACRVAAGAIAKQLLQSQGIELVAFLQGMGPIQYLQEPETVEDCKKHMTASSMFCPCPEKTLEMQEYIEQIKEKGDSVGGIIMGFATGLPEGLGEPVYDKLEAKLAYAMMSIPASKGFEIGSGFEAARMYGSTHNDAFFQEEGQVRLRTNNSGGTLGGISTGMPLQFRVAFKPTSSIRLKQESVNREGKGQEFSLPSGSRHDPCLAIRAVPVVEAMLALVLADSLLQKKAHAPLDGEHAQEVNF